MTRPRVFISSTFYDLKHIRTSLDFFIRNLGYEPVRNEQGDIPYDSDKPLDLACYDAVITCDILIMIIGGRYGSEQSGDSNRTEDFYKEYISVSRREFRTAVDNEIPVYVLIDKNVFGEYQTYLANAETNTVTYIQVDSISVYKMIKEILDRTHNNLVHPFEHFSEAEEWLKNQWAGLFQGYLSKNASIKQLASLSREVALLSETNKTLKRYLETIMGKSGAEETKSIIREESERLKEAEVSSIIFADSFGKWFIKNGFPEEELGKVVTESNSVEEFINGLNKISIPEDRRGNKNPFFISAVREMNSFYDNKDERLQESLNLLKMSLGLEAVEW